MSEFATHRSESATATTTLWSTMGIASGLVAVNVVLMLLLSYTPVADLGQVVFSNFFLGLGVFVVTVGGGHFLATNALEKNNVPLAGVGVSLTQFGYALFGSALLVILSSELRVPVLLATALITAGITAVVTAAVYLTDHSFERWNRYSAGLFVLGIGVGVLGVFVSSLLFLVASVFTFLAFVAYLAHEIWVVKTSGYGGTLANAIGIYVAVMGVFVHVLSWIIRLLSILDQ